MTKLQGHLSDEAQSAPATASPARPWPADRAERWPIERLIRYANNARLHTEADVDKIAASILRWGWTMPVLVDENSVLIVGHARVSAAAKLRLPSVPVIVAQRWTEDEKRAYRLADNQLAARASWDPDLLRNELEDLKFGDFNLDLIGFEPDRLAEILAGLGPSGLTDPDSIRKSPINRSRGWATFGY
jgi:ParB-like chromosome segregation protein Spo0J